MWTISQMLFQQMRQLDPHLAGLHIDLFYCFPSEDQIVRGLVQASHQDFGNVGLPSDTHLWFLGKKSLLGQAIYSGKPQLISLDEEEDSGNTELFLRIPGSCCIAAFPIQKSGEIGGGLLFYSLSTTFYHDYYALIQSYVEMFALAFEHFYPSTQIQLEDFPLRAQQRISLFSYRKRIAMKLSSLSQEEAEQKVLQEIQQELLKEAYG